MCLGSSGSPCPGCRAVSGPDRVRICGQTAPRLLADVHGHEYARRQVGREAADQLDEGLDPAGRPSDRHRTTMFHVE